MVGVISIDNANIEEASLIALPRVAVDRDSRQL